MQLQMKADPCTRVRFKMGQPALTPNNKHPPTPRLHQPRYVQLENTMQAPLMYTNWTVGIHFQTIEPSPLATVQRVRERVLADC
jgi:hypothetical protein